MSIEAVTPDDRARPSCALLERSNRLGADPRNTNYAGGNTSAKGTGIDPVTGTPVELLWVKGSGGDLGTLTEAGLAVLRLDRLRSLVDVYPGVEREDEMVAAFDYCLHGRGGAAPSIDTAMHGLVDAGHVDHLHPDSGIALATAADGEALTRRCFGDRVAWVDWRRPGFPARSRHGRDPAGPPRGDRGDPRRSRHHGLGRHVRRSARRARSRSSGRPSGSSTSNGRPEPFGAPIPGYEPLPEADRHARAAALLPLVRGLASTDRPQVGHYTDSEVVLDFVGTGGAPAAGRPRHVLPRPLPADQGPPDGPRPAAHGGPRPTCSAAARAARGLPRGVRRLLRAPRHARTARRCAAPTRRSCWSRASGCSRSGPTSRRRGSPASSTSTPSTSCAAPRRCRPTPRSPKSEKFRIEYWALEEAKLARMPKPKPLAARVAFVTGAGSGIGKAIAHRLAAEGACVVVADIDAASAETVARELGGTDTAISVAADVTDEAQVVEAFRAAVLAFGGRRPHRQQRRPVDLEAAARDDGPRLGSPARRDGPRLVPRLARGGADPDRAGDGRRPRLHRQQERPLRRPEQRRLRVRPRPTRRTRSGCSPRSSASTGSGSTASTRTASSAARGSSPRAGARTGRGPTASRRTSSASSMRSGRCSSARSCPEHVAAAVFALTGGDLSQTTGLHIPVDAGVAAAFLR